MDEATRADYVERFARLLEEGGETRIAGRIYAHLATAEAPYLGLQQLADELDVSRASISMNTRRLIGVGLLERVPVPGARGEHYGLTAAGPDALLAVLAERARTLAAVAEEGIALQRKQVTRGTQSLHAMREAYLGLAAAVESRIVIRTAAR
jgi:DNA-binding transcriptional regulator GbsR (MarR family)